jgi:hypothetical protein
MKNKFFILALLALLIPVIFTGCGGDNPKIVKEVKVSPINGNYGYVLTWDAVGKNVAGYEVYAKQEDKSTANPVAYGQNFVSYNSNMDPSPNSDADKWTAIVFSSPVTTSYTITSDFYFGVRTISTETKYSNIRWTKDKYKVTADIRDGYYD